MTPTELAQKYLYPYRTKGEEITPEYCPMCRGGGKDKFTFALNLTTGAWNCKRGSCGQQGSFSQLLEHFGERKYEIRPVITKSYKPPKTEIKPITSAVEAYLTKRGFSKKTWEKYGVGDDGKGNIAMPYYENGKLVFMKFRPAHKPAEGEKKGWRDADGKPVFWGMQFCSPADPLTICEGEMDMLALEESGVHNAVSVPSGTQDLACIDLCWDWLNQFKRVVIWVDSDEPGQELQRKLIQRLGAWRCFVVNSGRKDANEVLLFDGKDAVYQTWSHCVEVPQAGLIRLADVKTFDFSKADKVETGFRGVDEVLGGCYMGQTTLWTGKASSGKSTILGQVMLHGVGNGYGVCAYSGELPAPLFRYWIDLQAADTKNIETVYGKYRVMPEITTKIHAWYRDLFFLYDSFNAPTETSIFEVFEYAARRYDCKVFVIDNLMTLMLASASDGDWWAQQRRIIDRLCNFARSFNVHMHVVAHPKKVKGNAEREDVSGVAELTNRVDNVLIFRRLSDAEKKDESNNGCDAILTVDKNRMFGKQNQDIGLIFDDVSKRFSMPSDLTPKAYGWGDS